VAHSNWPLNAVLDSIWHVRRRERTKCWNLESNFMEALQGCHVYEDKPRHDGMMVCILSAPLGGTSPISVIQSLPRSICSHCEIPSRSMGEPSMTRLSVNPSPPVYDLRLPSSLGCTGPWFDAWPQPIRLSILSRKKPVYTNHIVIDSQVAQQWHFR
jgi:hypothetical protein